MTEKNNGEVQIIKKQLSYNEIAEIGKAFVASKMFGSNVDRISVAITKIMAGQELGLAPFASMRAVHVIEGNATLSANTMAAMVKSSGRYDYEIKKKETDGCTIDFIELRGGKRVKLGTETFDHDEAKAAGLLNKQNWQKYPKAMMFARCISNGVRTYCPDVFSGLLVYTPDELNARVSVSGDVIEGEAADDTKKETAAKKGDDVQEGEVVSEGVDDPAPEDESQEVSEAPTSAINDPIDPTKDVVSESDDSDTTDDASEEIADVDKVEEPEIVVDDEFKDQVRTAYESLIMPAPDKSKLLREATGKLTIKNLTEDIHWKNLHAAMVLLDTEAA